MAHEYFYLGENTALTKLHNSESFICIDTRSWESLIYAQGAPVEPNELSVFLRFLSPGDVVLDIGANFGLYSVRASEIMSQNGKLFTFEANPHTFKYLQKTAISNRLLWLPQHKFINAAVSETAGETQFVYDPEGLGGAHIPLPGEDLGLLTVVRVPMISIDGLLEHDLKVDLVKIDVEGHELGVIKGMVKTIERSDNIRILMEYYTGTKEITPRGRELVEFVWSLGLSICSVESEGHLRLLESKEIPTGNIYLFATRSPYADITRSRNSIPIRMKSFQYHAVFAKSKTPLLQADGRFRYRRNEHIGVEEPTLFFGPYIALKAGRYRIRAHGKARGAAHVSLTHQFGSSLIKSSIVTEWNQPVEFDLPEAVTAFEIIVRRLPDLESLDITEIEIDKIGEPAPLPTTATAAAMKVRRPIKPPAKEVSWFRWALGGRQSNIDCGEQPEAAMQEPNNEDMDRWLADLLRPTDDISRPNIHALRVALQDIEALKLNMKCFGSELAARLRVIRAAA
jgi:FkbM family methyltransferase